MTPAVLQPFLSEISAVTPKPHRAPKGAFGIARVSQNTPWTMRAVKVNEGQLPTGVVTSRKRSDMSRHATVMLA